MENSTLILAAYSILTVIIRLIPTFKNMIFINTSGNATNKVMGIIHKILAFLNYLSTASVEIGKNDNELKKIVACKILSKLAEENNTIYEIVEKESKVLKSRIKLCNTRVVDLNAKTEIETIIEKTLRR